MDKSLAKSFVYRDIKTDKVYVSKDLQKLLDMSSNRLNTIFAVIDTESGETLMYMDWAYSGEPIIMGRFIHKEFYFSMYEDEDIIDLDKQTDE